MTRRRSGVLHSDIANDEETGKLGTSARVAVLFFASSSRFPEFGLQREQLFIVTIAHSQLNRYATPEFDDQANLAGLSTLLAFSFELN